MRNGETQIYEELEKGERNYCIKERDRMKERMRNRGKERKRYRERRRWIDRERHTLIETETKLEKQIKKNFVNWVTMKLLKMCRDFHSKEPHVF